MVGPISQPLPLPPSELPPSKEEKDLFTTYSEGLKLLAEANLPEPLVINVSQILTAIAGINKTVSDPKISHQNERKAVAESLKKWAVKWGKFSKKHPGYGIGIVLGFVLLSIGAVMIIGTLSHLPPLKLVHGYVTLGVAIGIVSLYYGIALIDMGRRAAIKERWEMKIAQVTKAKQASRSANESDIKELRGEIILEIEARNSEYKKKVEDLKNERNAILKTRKEELAQLKAWRAARLFLEELLTTEIFVNFPEKVKKDMTRYLEKSGEKIAAGGTASLKNVNQSLLDEPLFRKELSDSFVIPETAAQPENIKISQQIREKFQEFLQKAQKNYVKHPVSTGILLTGVVITLVSLPVLYYYLSGAQSIYVIGAVGVEPILHFLIYGLSLIYEGRNSASISKLEDKARDYEKKIAEEEHRLEAETLKRTRWLYTSLERISSFQKEWTEYFNIQKQSYKDRLVSLQKERANEEALIHDCIHFISELTMSVHEFSPTPDDKKKIEDLLRQLASISKMISSTLAS